ncbi:hypothetical protein ACFOU2_21845 [Bacillus songklensis]|uniref:HTH araC/xylS-type domain-containing protein n=1 Tax=Bacillus songklensis TaxID=1069116 RepID=A0ABV8B6N2_9BACI
MLTNSFLQVTEIASEVGYNNVTHFHWVFKKMVARYVNPDDLDYLCEGCSWLSYGVCKEGIASLKEQYQDSKS